MGAIYLITQRSTDQGHQDARAKSGHRAPLPDWHLRDHHQRVVSGRDATSTHGPIHTGTSPQLSGRQ
jgi:hypothetical protein